VLAQAPPPSESRAANSGSRQLDTVLIQDFVGRGGSIPTGQNSNSCSNSSVTQESEGMSPVEIAYVLFVAVAETSV